MTKKMLGLRVGVLAVALALAPGSVSFANGRDDHDRSRSGRDHGDRDGHGDRDRDRDRDHKNNNGGYQQSHSNIQSGSQVVCYLGGTYTVESAAVPLILIYGGTLGACPASPSR